MDVEALTAEDLGCPICMERLRDPFVTPCGHSFCYSCITVHLNNKSVCPCCGEYLTADKVFPNYLLSKVVARAAKAELKKKGTVVEQLQAAIISEEERLRLSDIDLLLETLEERKQDMKQREKENNLELLLHFLNHSKESKTRKLQELQEELQILDKDIDQVETRQGALPATAAGLLALAGSNGGQSQGPVSTTDSAPQVARDGVLLPQADSGTSLVRRESLAPASTTGFQQRPQQSGRLDMNLRQHLRQSLESTAPADLSSRLANGEAANMHAEVSVGTHPGTSRPLGASGLYQPNGQHRSTSALGLDQLADSSLCGPPPPRVADSEHAASELQPTSSSVPSSSDPAHALSSDASLPPTSSSLPPTSAGQPQPITPLQGQPSLFPSSTNPWLPPVDSVQTASGALTFPDGSSTFPPRVLPFPERAMRVSGGYEGRGLSQGVPLAGSFSPDPVQPSVGQSPTEPSSGTGRTSGTATTSMTRSTSGAADDEPHIRARKRKFESQFEDLQQHYLRMRHKQLVESKRGKPEEQGLPAQPSGATDLPASGRAAGNQQTAVGVVAGQAAVLANAEPSGSAFKARQDPSNNVGPVEADDLKEFSRMLSMFTHHSKLKVLASMPGASQRTSAAILSSIAFDRDAGLFATAGVSKRISIFNYQEVLTACANSRDRQASTPPAAELVSRSKLSCLSWNCFCESHLISSDYEGVITLWDTHAGQPLAEYEAHEKRIWSIDSCPSNSQLLVSGSDDGFVKVWSTNQASSAADIDMKANVCCVQYSPHSQHELVVGCADHYVHLYDMRNYGRPVHVFSGHRKAVSYVRYMSSTEVVSASTDSTLRLWSTQACEPKRTYTGHVNEKNFVGLSSDGDFVACGSETSEVFVYYRSMSKPIAKRLFSPPVPMPSGMGGAAPSRPNLQFISAVCWKPASQTLLAANSQGAIKVLQLSS